MSETRPEQEGDRRVAAAVAAIVLLMLVVAGIVAVAATAYRDGGSGGEAAEMPPAPSNQPTGEEPPVSSTQPGSAIAGAGVKVFADNCSGCHGVDGHGGNGGPDLAGVENPQAVITQVTNGGGGMPAFGETLTDQQIRGVAAFVTSRIAR